MGRFFKIVGVVAVVLAIGGVAALGALIVKASDLDRESRAYVLAAIPAITSAWDKRELMSRASPELVKVADAEKLETLFTRFGQLGPIVSFDKPKGQAGAFYTPSGAREIASYVSNATFQNGTARLRLQLSKQNGRWMILGFYIDSMKVSPPSHI